MAISLSLVRRPLLWCDQEEDLEKNLQPVDEPWEPIASTFPITILSGWFADERTSRVDHLVSDAASNAMILTRLV